MTCVIHIQTRYRILVVEISRKCLATYSKKKLLNALLLDYEHPFFTDYITFYTIL